MADNPFDQLASLHQQQGSAAALDRLIDTLREQKLYHKLFDARLLKRKHELGLPLSRPASLADVPDALRKDVEATYVEAAREAGRSFLADGDIPAAWMYLQVIREPDEVAAAIDKLPTPREYDQRSDELLNIALYQGVNPVKGVQMMLRAHGTCSTITALDQVLPSLSVDQRRACAKAMVRSLYDDLRDSIGRQVQQRMPLLTPDASLRELLAGRDWLFSSGGYHVDVSHLHSVVRFARSIDPPAQELELALQLAEYGTRLDATLQYPGEPPFDDVYPAHAQFFKALLGRDRAAALQYFRDKLEHEPDEQDRPLLAYVLVDLLMRTGQLSDAVDVAAKYLTNVGDDVSFSFADLCRDAGRLDVLRETASSRGDLVGYAAALLQQSDA